MPPADTVWGSGPGPASTQERERAAPCSQQGPWVTAFDKGKPCSPAARHVARALLCSHAGLCKEPGEADCQPSVEDSRGTGRLVTHSGTSCCASGTADLFGCNPVRFDLRFGPGAGLGPPALPVGRGAWFPGGAWLLAGRGASPPSQETACPAACGPLPGPGTSGSAGPTESSSLGTSFLTGLRWRRRGQVGVAAWGQGCLSPFCLEPGAQGIGPLCPEAPWRSQAPHQGSTTFLTAFATLFRDRPWASAGLQLRWAFMAGVEAGLLAL